MSEGIQAQARRKRPWQAPVAVEHDDRLIRGGLATAPEGQTTAGGGNGPTTTGKTGS